MQKILGIDFEYVDNSMSLIQIADKEYIYIIDYLKLIYCKEFFPSFSDSFKGRKFIAFDYSSEDINLLSNDFKQFFENLFYRNPISPFTPFTPFTPTKKIIIIKE